MHLPPSTAGFIELALMQQYVLADRSHSIRGVFHFNCHSHNNRWIGVNKMDVWKCMLQHILHTKSIIYLFDWCGCCCAMMCVLQCSSIYIYASHIFVKWLSQLREKKLTHANKLACILFGFRPHHCLCSNIDMWHQ